MQEGEATRAAEHWLLSGSENRHLSGLLACWQVHSPPITIAAPQAGARSGGSLISCYPHHTDAGNTPLSGMEGITNSLSWGRVSERRDFFLARGAICCLLLQKTVNAQKRGLSLFFFNPTPICPRHAVQHALFTSNNTRPLLLFLQVLGLKIKTIHV